MLLLLKAIYYILKICEHFFIFLNDLRALHTPKPFNIPYKSCYISVIKFALPVVFSVLLNYVVLDNVFDNWMWLEYSINVFWNSDASQKGLTQL